MSTYETAQAWIHRTGKRPRPIEVGLWRWTLPDPPPAWASHELPKEVFDLLSQDPATNHRWLYPSRESAEQSLVMAVYTAMQRGWEPKS